MPTTMIAQLHVHAHSVGQASSLPLEQRRQAGSLPHRFLAVAALLAASATLTGCLSDPKPPAFKVVDVGVTERTADGVVVTFTLEGTNPNKDPLPLDAVSYTLALDGRPAASATRQAEAELPANGTQRVRLPVAIPVSASSPEPTGTSGYRLSGSMVYRIPGSIAEVFFDAGLRRPSTAFGESGTLDFSKAVAQ
jgi:hypothetical protein